MNAGISINLRSPVPPFEQIRAQIASLITVGTLAPGIRLPTVRSLASDLGLAAGTVARAYKELELAGLIETRRRNGTVVAGTPAPPARADAHGQGAATAEVLAAVDRYIAEGRNAGLDDPALLEILRARQGWSHE